MSKKKKKKFRRGQRNFYGSNGQEFCNSTNIF